MLTVNTIEKVRQNVKAARMQGKTIGFVPTMGGLHDGHLSLIKAARKSCDYVVVSIFLNPTQFAPTEDLSSYPSTPQQDIDRCEANGVDLAFMPDVKTMYPSGAMTEVAVNELAKNLCGKNRPTHFAGVCTVVSKLFNIVQPDKAYFGQKDFQQLAIIRKMVDDLNFSVEIISCPIIREDDGLAMSTRNKYLDADQRKQAVALSESLKIAADLIRKEHPSADAVIKKIKQYLGQNAPDGNIDYVQIVDPETLEDVQNTDNIVVIALAVKLGTARLIDNMIVD